VTVDLRVDRDGSPSLSLPLVGRWLRAEEDRLEFRVDGDLLEGEVRLPMAGTIVVRPRRALGGIVGLHRIALDVTVGSTRLHVDGEVGPPPYWRGISLPGRADTGRRTYDVRVSIDVLHLLSQWPHMAAAPIADG
jgi:hypothetical protein